MVRLTNGPGPDTAIAISGDGKRLAFTVRTERTRIWSIPFVAARSRITGKGEAITEPGVDALEPSLSLDGRNLAYLSRRAGKWELWVKSLEDGRDKLLLADEYRRLALRWSRDGKRLSYGRFDFAKSEETAFVLSPDGTEQRLTSPKPPPWGAGVADWSPDGEWLLLLRSERPTGGRWQICLAPVSAAPAVEAQARILVADPAHNFYNASYSPDGRWILFQAEDVLAVGISKIGVAQARGGEWMQITQGKFWDDKPHWSPDGKTIYFLSNRGGFQNVWGIRFDPIEGKPRGEPFRVTSFDSPDLMLRDFADISFARDRLVLPLTEVSGNIWMLENVDR